MRGPFSFQLTPHPGPLPQKKEGNNPMILQQLINGLTLGSLYALIALGYTMVYGVLLMINFAHSEIFMSGAFVSLLCYEKFAHFMPPAQAFLAGIVIAFVICALLAITIERVAYRP